MSTSSVVPFRILPRLTEQNREFWQGGERNELRFWRCQDCAYYIHPPQPLCPMCFSKNMGVEAVCGDATLTSFSINYQPWMPGPELPYVVAIVEMVEQPGLRLTTNLVNCPIDQIRCDMAVQVIFEHHEDADGDIWLPLFEPRHLAKNEAS